MKRYSGYFYSMMFASLFTGLLGLLLIAKGHPSPSAVMLVFSFIFWFAGVMAPDNEKYKREH